MKFESTEQKYKGAHVQLEESMFSFIQATDESSFVAKFIEGSQSPRKNGVDYIFGV